MGNDNNNNVAPTPYDSKLKTFCMSDDGYGGINHYHQHQYIEVTLEISCVNAEGTLSMMNYNVPGCVSLWCSPSQSQTLLQDIGYYTDLVNSFVEETSRAYDWSSCTTELVSIFAPHYDPFFAKNNNPQFEQIVVIDKDKNVVTDVEKNGTTTTDNNNNNNNEDDDNNNDNVVETQTYSPIVTDGEPEFGSIFEPIVSEAP